MFTMKYNPNKWMMTVRFNTGGGPDSNQRGVSCEDFEIIHAEKYGPFATKEDGWILYYALKAEDEYGTIRPNPYFEQVAAPPELSVKQKFAAAKHVMHDPHLEYWKPLYAPFPHTTKEQVEHQIDISNYILKNAADDLSDNIGWTPISKSPPMSYQHHPVCGCNRCWTRHFNVGDDLYGR